MGCGCGRRRANVVTGIIAIARGDVKTAIVEAKDFARTAVKDVKMATYLVKRRIQHSGIWHEIDEQWEMDGRDVDHLLEAGAIELVPQAPAKAA